jgi:hypothetical protein
VASRNGAAAQRQKKTMIDENLKKHHVAALRCGAKNLGLTRRRNDNKLG